MPEYYAHSINLEGKSHSLVEHLRAVASQAREFSRPFGGEEVAYYAGLWHDLGKFDPEFQRYLSGDLPRGPDHKAAGTRLACQHLGPGGLLVQGHHGGLRAMEGLQAWVNEKAAAKAATRALESAHLALPDLEPPEQPKIPAFVKSDPLRAELWTRMLFSALVDADFLDTEQHFNPGKTTLRNQDHGLEQLWERFQVRHREITGASTGLVNTIRKEVYRACLSAADMPPGIFRLTVPTGGGKTLSAMGFALRHASAHGQRRVITASPYMSITQQTAGVYRQFLEEDPQADPSAVLEHHSMAEPNESEEYQSRLVWTRLAAENWDAPVVVTTTVQLFQSLFSNRTSSTRKLHRLAGSVIILDEAQNLPPGLLDPILNVLKELTDNYGASVVLSTATQPAFDSIKPFADVSPTEIVPDHHRHFKSLKRVDYQWKTGSPVSWEEVAEMMRRSPQVLTVLNTKKDALSLLEALGDEQPLHLSTCLCGRHRQETIREIQRRLDHNLDCRVVATQVVETGVDLDFPLVMRAVGPMDSIIQAAGRCNRSGRLERGQVVVFQPVGGSLPRGHYRYATQETMSIINSGPVDLDDPETVSKFFRRVFIAQDTDAQEIQQRRKKLNYPEVSERFRMIEGATVEAVVTTYGNPEERQRVRTALDRLREGTAESRLLLRQLQPWKIQLYESQVADKERNGLIAQVMPGVYEWLGRYDRVTASTCSRPNFRVHVPVAGTEQCGRPPSHQDETGRKAATEKLHQYTSTKGEPEGPTDEAPP